MNSYPVRISDLQHPLEAKYFAKRRLQRSKSNELTSQCVTLVASWGPPTSGLHNCSRPDPAKAGALALARSVLPDSQGDSQEGGSMRTRTDEPGLTRLTNDRDRTVVDMCGR